MLDHLARIRLGPLGRPLAGLLSTSQGRYLVVAGSVQLGYLVLLAALLSTGIWYMAAIAMAQVVAISVAFPTYRRLVYRSTGPWRSEIGRFVSVWAGGATAGFVVTPLLVELTPIPPLAAQVIAVVVVACGSYLGHHYVSFRHHHADRKADAGPEGPAGLREG